MAKLKVLKNGIEVQSVDVARLGKTSVVLGRDEAADIRLDDRAVGREHAVISIRDKGLSIQKKSKFGLMSINGQEADEGFVKPGDVISIADYRVEVSPDTSVNLPPPEASVAPTVVSAPVEVQAEGLAPLDVAGPSASIEMPALEDASVSLGGAPSSSGISLETPEPAQPVEGASNTGVSTPSLQLASGTNSQGLDMAVPSAAPAMDFNAEGGDRTAMISTASLDVKLSFKPGDANVEDYKLEKSEVSIGRGADCDIILMDKTASRKHVMIRKVGATFVLQDLGSGNGTSVNGQKVSQHELQAGDLIRIGDTEFGFHAVNADYVQNQHAFEAVSADEPMQDFGSIPVPDPHANPIPGGFAGEVPGALPQGVAAGADAFAGIPGMATGPAKKENLIEKFKRQPMIRKVMIVGVLLIVLFFAFDDGDAKKKPAKKDPNAKTKTDDGFAKLAPEKKQFVINTYNLAMDLYKKQEYERSLFEIKKVLEMLPNGYKDAKDLQVYSERAIETARGQADEKRRKEEAERVSKAVAQYLKDAEEHVNANRDPEARAEIMKVFEMEPDNATALRLRQTLDDRIEKKKRDEMEAQDIALKKQNLSNLVAEGRKLYKAGQYYQTIDKMMEAPSIGSNDEKLLLQAKKLIVDSRNAIKNKAAPFIKRGEDSLAIADYVAARDAFEDALKIEVDNQRAIDGLSRIREELHKQSKVIYSDAVIAESVSDFTTAKAKYNECLLRAMKDDIYYGRCQRKLKRFQITGEGQGSGATASSATGEGRGSDPQMPGESDNAGDPSRSTAGDPQMPTLPAEPMDGHE